MIRLILILLLFAPTLAWGACTEGNECTRSGTTYTCPTLELACIQDAHDAASNGDTISLPSGTLEWPNANTSTLKLTKAVKIIGQGKSSTIIQMQDNTGSNGVNCYDGNASYAAGACFISFKPDAAAIATIDSLDDTNTFEISGIYFQILNKSEDYYSECIYISPATTTAVRRIKIHDNKMDGVQQAIHWDSNVYGVFYSNELVDSGMCRMGGASNAWSDEPLVLGGPDYMYLEDNTITGVPVVENSVHCSGGQGGRYSVRFNNIDAFDYLQVFEWHGNQHDATPYGTMGVEIYGNKFTNTANTATTIGRGGKVLVHHNYNDSDTYGHRIAYKVYEECPNGSWRYAEKPSAVGESTITPSTALDAYDYTTGYSVVVRATGGGTDATKTRDIVSYTDGVITVASPLTITTDDYFTVINDAVATYDQTLNGYYFNNYNLTSLVTTVKIDTSVSSWWNGLAEDVSFYRSYPMTGDGSFDGTKGVGCGTLATLQGAAYFTSCTDGVGFWIPNSSIDPTAASCSDISGYTGANNATVASAGNMGSLYKCTSTDTWTSYYTPYTYPHPLRGTGKASVSIGSGSVMSIGSGATATLY